MKEREGKKISSSFEIFFFSPAAHARQNCNVVVPESYERIITKQYTAALGRDETRRGDRKGEGEDNEKKERVKAEKGKKISSSFEIFFFSPSSSLFFFSLFFSFFSLKSHDRS